MSELRATAGAFAMPRRRRGAGAGAGLRDLLTPVLAVLAISLPAWAQQWVGEPPVAPELKAALAKADAGSPGELTALADAGRPDAQFYAGVTYMFGRGGIPKDGVRGCAYEEKASVARADAMHMVGLCYQQGLGGKRDADKAKAAFTRAAALGFPKSKCALGAMLTSEPAQAERGVQMCRESAMAGDVDAQLWMGETYYSGGGPVKPDLAEARKWYDLAAKQQNPLAARRLGEMYAKGEGGGRDPKKALELWRAAEAAGDPFVAILVADQLFFQLTGRTPGPGKYTFRGGAPVKDIEVVQDWYREAINRDPRPEVQKRAQYALSILTGFATGKGAQPGR